MVGGVLLAGRQLATDADVYWVQGNNSYRRGHKYFRQQIEFFNNACQIKLNELHVPMRHAVNGGEVGS